jgi:hypothetical protein
MESPACLPGQILYNVAFADVSGLRHRRRVIGDICT